MGEFCCCVECVGEHPEPTEFEFFIANTEAEYRLRGLGEKDAKEKAIEDWYAMKGEKNGKSAKVSPGKHKPGARYVPVRICRLFFGLHKTQV